MKYCPACNFSFPDFHHVCDFDGTELVPEPGRAQLINTRPSRLRSALKSPVFLSVLACIALLSTALLNRYSDSAPQIPPVVMSGDWSNSINNEVPLAEASEQSLAPSHRLIKRHLNRLPAALAASARREAIPVRRAARKQQVTFKASAPQNTETVRRRETQPISNETAARIPATRNSEISAREDPSQIPHQKELKLTSMLKTTWHFLKKPFKF